MTAMATTASFVARVANDVQRDSIFRSRAEAFRSTLSTEEYVQKQSYVRAAVAFEPCSLLAAHPVTRERRTLWALVAIDDPDGEWLGGERRHWNW